MAPGARQAFQSRELQGHPQGQAPVSNFGHPHSMDHLVCYTPADLAGRTPPDLGPFRWKLLAQGDSWFSNSRDKLNAHANLLQELVFKSGTVAVNCAGTGNALSFEINTSRATRTLAVSYFNPYVTQDGISRTLELYDRKSDLARLGLGSVDLKSTGGSVRFGVPFTEFDTVFFGLGFEGTKIGLTQFSPLRYVQYVEQFSEDSEALLGTIGWARDSRDMTVPSGTPVMRATSS